MHERIRNAAVVPMPDAVLGERMCVYLIVHDGAQLTVKDLSTHLTERGVATYKHPERVEIVDDFPLSPFGKVQKNVLAARIAEVLGSEAKG
jgi:2,3-dihydroxybenzoate-AMP ligase